MNEDQETSQLDNELASLLKIAEKSLSAWGLQGELSLIKHRENAVYRLQTESGEKFALRVHRANYHSDASLESELTWMRALEEAGIGVGTPIPAQSGENFVTVSVDDLADSRQVDLLAWVNGEQIGSVEDGLGDDVALIEHIYGEIGRVAAKVHNQAVSWQVPAGYERHAWDVDGLVGENPF